VVGVYVGVVLLRASTCEAGEKGGHGYV
jgi:hypothetical protein